MREKEMLAIVQALARQPTAPFREDAVRAEIEAQLGKCPHVKFERDDFGNVIAHYRRGRTHAGDWALAPQLNHRMDLNPLDASLLKSIRPKPVAPFGVPGLPACVGSIVPVRLPVPVRRSK